MRGWEENERKPAEPKDSQNSRTPSRDSNLRPPEYEMVVLNTRQQRSVAINNNNNNNNIVLDKYL
jgi:hypothetical protein